MTCLPEVVLASVWDDGEKGQETQEANGRWASHGAKAKEEAWKSIKAECDYKQHQIRLILNIHKVPPSGLMRRATEAETHWALQPGIGWCSYWKKLVLCLLASAVSFLTCNQQEWKSGNRRGISGIRESYFVKNQDLILTNFGIRKLFFLHVSPPVKMEHTAWLGKFCWFFQY